MQAALKEGYTKIGDELALPSAPVGLAFQEAKNQNPNIDLWSEDNSHPSLKGTYLAACVFYAKIFEKSPVGSSYISELSKEDAKLLQQVAEKVVLKQK